MASAPKVQTIAQAMKELNPAYAESKAIVGKQQAGLGAKYDAQRAGITAERGEGFNVINNQATARGGSFSGIPVEEQARYLSTKFLPGMQQANYQQNEEGLAMQGQLAEINKQQRLGAVGRVDQQKAALNSWNMQQQTLEQQRKEAEKQRQFQAEQSRLDQQFTAGQNAANRAASASSSSGPSVAQEWGARMGAAATVKGGYVSSTDWKAMSREFTSGGYGTHDDFKKRFSSFVEPSQWKTYR